MKQRRDGFIMKIGAPIGYLIVFIGLVGIILVFTFSTNEKPIAKETVKTSTLLITGVILPDKIDFAGEQVPLDLNQVSRLSDAAPDLGAYEYIYIPKKEK